MKLSELKEKKKLVEVTLDAEKVIELLGEPITFHTWNRCSIDEYMAMIDSADSTSLSEQFGVVQPLILDEDGKPMIEDPDDFPAPILMAALNAVVLELGKLSRPIGKVEKST